MGGHYNMALFLVRRDVALTWQHDRNGYTPLHLAAMNGRMEILKFLLGFAPTCINYLTRERETALHLAVRFNRCKAFVLLAMKFTGMSILNKQDGYGNTVLHLAVTGGHYQVRISFLLCVLTMLAYSSIGQIECDHDVSYVLISMNIRFGLYYPI